MSDKELIDLFYAGITIKKTAEKLWKVLGHKQAYFFNGYKTEGHTGFLNDVVVTFIDKTDGSDPTSREQCLMKTLDTLE